MDTTRAEPPALKHRPKQPEPLAKEPAHSPNQGQRHLHRVTAVARSGPVAGVWGGAGEGKGVCANLSFSQSHFP